MFQDPSDQNFVSNKTTSYHDLGEKKNIDIARAAQCNATCHSAVKTGRKQKCTH